MGAHTFILASDSFKGSATSQEVETYIAEGIRSLLPTAKIYAYPVADGGEGTVAALVAAGKGTLRTEHVHGPLGEELDASYAVLEDGSALIECAAASGITLTYQTTEEALAASTFGTGELIRAALDEGCRHILVGLGGSATTDGGAGMAEALGVRFLAKDGKPIPPGIAGLAELAKIDISGADPRLASCTFEALSDVANPLAGPDGAVFVYGPQKGLPRERLSELDHVLARYGRLVGKATGQEVSSVAGAGAAGGLGAGLAAFCAAKIRSGIKAILDALSFDEHLGEADLVVTGEGRMDAQTAKGKAPVGIARRAKRFGVPVAAVVGSCADDIEAVYEAGIDIVLSCVTAPSTLEECIEKTPDALRRAGRRLARIVLLAEQLD
ncbi:MAG: glycerate kinase [Atopobiaceae bacterium]